ncbi:hypothetical protein BU16DRAFT_559381 [Lophium mytilinum]|uniref:Uncharacterized protein n=1 Tax=Lophium mytilinum TaxID=390894 RepID=A0A6A6QYW8_9PEZI|nr:hypothetical protein BU16DRAFT_559381 [Lophium mytilinum]
MTVRHNKAKIERHVSQIRTTQKLLEFALSILTVKSLWRHDPQKSESNKATEMAQIKSTLSAWKDNAQKERENVLAEAQEVDENVDLDPDIADATAKELRLQAEICADFVAASDRASETLESVKLDQQIGNVNVGKGAVSHVGMPKSVLELQLVSRQHIGNVTVGDESKSEVGIR